MYEREKTETLAYVQDEMGWPQSRVVDVKHDRVIPDGILILVETTGTRDGVTETWRWALLVRERTGNVAEDSLEEADFIRGTVA